MAEHTTDRFCTSCGSCRVGTVDPYTGETLVEVDVIAIPDDVAADLPIDLVYLGGVSELLTLSEGGDMSAAHVAHEQGWVCPDGWGARRVQSSLLHLQQHRMVTHTSEGTWSITPKGESLLVARAKVGAL